MASSPHAVAYAELNVGVETTTDPDAAATSDTNVGVETTPDPDAAGYVDLNTGVHQTQAGNTAQYGAYGDVDTSTPTPHIWFIRPPGGAVGDGVQIIGHGFGPDQAAYNGQLQHAGPTPEDWVPTPVTNWTQAGAGPDAYGPGRVIDPVAGIAVTEHQRIDFTIPETALPPGRLLRVQTDGP